MKANTNSFGNILKGERLNIFCLTCQKPTCSMCKVSLKIRFNRQREHNVQNRPRPRSAKMAFL